MRALPDEAQERLMAVENHMLRGLLAQLYQAISEDDYPKPPTHAEETVTLALLGKLGPELQGIIDKRVEAFKRTVQLFPAEAKERQPEAYWRLVGGSMRAIWRHQAIKGGDLSREVVARLRTRFQTRQIDSELYDGFDSELDASEERYP